ncbi:UbiA prenyltransferase [Methanococcus vannielii SB]|uniref:Digeranylgeranylglyceryl phosphate synthase n=1 Tax=Methanococcus vannielii (strain ATCC 35089 / DSM 1224 / JCM 13029 / OCM 148 / SB) TaxID=406327 RepID=DGGGP_METVS|nr:UbiA family prenyltransferase [Methanococcus vannielii]A6UQV8.1 RecName: Full=Digeranylgeranylglyceryl phosphate synthase; Short=DGGGP synthase; Short=DGGGPS; AltName: Full=(S)-2,3-di-O-geranylgeranylglyceryl phosphate synthase; AltName: Full=Geranylgeranylglycerol-phosphate geranylgeranyltransferase [Methanococcus vannielii SB]ABR54880.1 UbiA prenyltransferase [Methanococcus vannielii SB]
MDLKAYFELIRLKNCLTAGFGALISGLIASNFTFGALFPLILAFLVVFFICGFGNSLNDIYDLKIDRINKPFRPIPSKRISLTDAKVFSYSIMIFGLIISLFNIYCFLMAVLNAVVLQKYAKIYKKNKIIGNMLVAYLTGSVFIFGGIAVGNVNVSLYLFSCAMFSMWAREIIKDYEDIEGDLKEKVSSLPIKYGEKSIYISLGLLLIAIGLSFLPYLTGIFGIYYLLMILICNLMFLAGFFNLLNAPSKKQARKTSKNIKLITNFVLIAFIIGSIFK